MILPKVSDAPEFGIIRKMALTLDQLVFLAPILMIGVASFLHSFGYLHGDGAKRRGWFYFYFLGTLAAMIGVVLAPSKYAFILAWEAMGLFSSGLVGFESASQESRRATWIYLLACHAGAVFLILAGALSMKAEPDWVVIWYLALVGFGLKIGFPPFHVWLPEAHPAAPAPASAVMSGAMIPLGFWGLLRWIPVHTQILEPHIAWSMLVFGSLAALGGILFALPQRNIKKLLAFSSVENMGVIALAFAMWIFGESLHDGHDGVGTEISYLALLGGALHVLNHAVLKGGLFLGAGSVLRYTGTLDCDKLGGLMKKLPGTGTLFTLSAFGLSGLPPLPAFFSEFCIYAAAITALANHVLVLPAAIVLIVLATTGGIAAAAYTKIVSATFLGAPRNSNEIAEVSGRSQKAMFVAQALLFIPSAILMAPIALLVALLSLVRRYLLPRGKAVSKGLTWDCGYEQPTARMAWTGTAFSQPLADTFKDVLNPRKHVITPPGPFPGDAAIVTETDDAGLSRFWGPIFHVAARLFQRAHLLQNGSLHLYILMMIVAIVVLLIWGAFV